MERRGVTWGHDRLVQPGRVPGMPTPQGNAGGDPCPQPPVHDAQPYPRRLTRLAEWLSSRGVSRRRRSRLGQGSTPSGHHGVRDEARAPDEHPAPAGLAVRREVEDLGPALKKSPDTCGAGRRGSVLQDHGVTGHVGLGIHARARHWTSDSRRGPGTSMVLRPRRSLGRAVPTDVTSGATAGQPGWSASRCPLVRGWHVSHGPPSSSQHVWQGSTSRWHCGRQALSMRMLTCCAMHDLLDTLEPPVVIEPTFQFRHRSVCLEVDVLILPVRHSLSTKMWSTTVPRPSMLMATPASSNLPVKT